MAKFDFSKWANNLKGSDRYAPGVVESVLNDAKNSVSNWNKFSPEKKRDHIRNSLKDRGRVFDPKKAEEEAYHIKWAQGRTKNIDKAHRQALIENYNRSGGINRGRMLDPKAAEKEAYLEEQRRYNAQLMDDAHRDALIENRNRSRVSDPKVAERQAYEEYSRREQQQKERDIERGRVKNVDKAYRQAHIENRQRNMDSRRDDILGRRKERLDYRDRRDSVLSRRQGRLDARAERDTRNNFISNIQDRIAGSSASRDTIENAYNDLSSSQKWQGMTETERIQSVMDHSINSVARNTVMGRMSQEEIKELSGNATLHDVIDQRAIDEEKLIRGRIDEARKNRSSGGTQESTPKTAQEQALDNPVNSPSGTPSSSGGGGAPSSTGGESSSGSGGSSKPSKSVGSVDAVYQGKRFDAWSNELQQIHKDGGLTAEVAENFAKKIGMNQSEDFVNMVGKGNSSDAIAMFNKERGRYTSREDIGWMDKAMARKIPQVAGGALLTAGLVNAMSASRGQQSNSALYGQSQPYY